MAVTNAVVDISHHNGSVDFVAARAAGLIGVIHKATQGTDGVDNTYATRRPKAEQAGLLWGAYHFGTGGDGTAQADHFLGTVGDPTGVLLVLDFEGNPSGSSMTLDQARAFVTRVKDKTGRWPGFYSGHDIKEQLKGKDPVLGACWFWLAQYGSNAVVPANWKAWTLWQYTDGAVGPEPHQMTGVGPCDRDKFNGSEADLRAFWTQGRP